MADKLALDNNSRFISWRQRYLKLPKANPKATANGTEIEEYTQKTM